MTSLQKFYNYIIRIYGYKNEKTTPQFCNTIDVHTWRLGHRMRVGKKTTLESWVSCLKRHCPASNIETTQHFALSYLASCQINYGVNFEV